MSRSYHGKSDSQANADALERRAAPFAPENRTSAGMAYDWRRRQAPRDLRDAVRLVRKAYQDEVPTKLHESGLADDGTPAMTAKAEAYIFGSATWTDAGKGESPLVSYFLTPFRATLDGMERHPSESTRKRAAIVRHVTIGSQAPEQAALIEGVPSWCSRLVAFDALTTFLRCLSDVKVNVTEAVA